MIAIAYRARALDILRRLAAEGDPDRTEIRKIESQLLRSFGETAYLESEHETTFAEQMVELEEKGRERFSLETAVAAALFA